MRGRDVSLVKGIRNIFSTIEEDVTLEGTPCCSILSGCSRALRNVRGIIWNRVNQETKNHRNPLISYKQPCISNMNKNYTFNRRIKFSVRTGGIHRECNWKILPNFYTSNRFPLAFSIDYFLRGLRE